MGTSLSKDDVIRIVEERNIKFIRLWFTDVLGFLKSLAMTRRELEGALEEGMGFDGSSIEGFARIDESDMVAMPDPSTFAVMPSMPDTGGTARIFCDIVHLMARPYAGDPRLGAEADAGQGGRPGLHDVRGPGAGVLLLQGQRPYRGAGSGRVFRPHLLGPLYERPPRDGDRLWRRSA